MGQRNRSAEQKRTGSELHVFLLTAVLADK